MHPFDFSRHLQMGKDFQVDIFKLRIDQSQPQVLFSEKSSFGSDHYSMLSHFLSFDHFPHFLFFFSFDLRPEENFLPLLLIFLF